MSTTAYAINHCALRDEITGGDAPMSKEDFKEAVMQRAGELVESAKTGKRVGKPHQLGGVEIVAYAIATATIKEGARQIAEDVGVDLDELEELAASQHISAC